MEKKNAFEVVTRKKLFDEIEKAPGLHFRELKRRTNMAIGSLQYHLDYLEKNHYVRILKDQRFKRYYPITATVDEDKEVIALLRQDKIKQLCLLLLNKKFLNLQQLSKQIQVGESTTSWYLQKLQEKNLIERKRKKQKMFYGLLEKEKIQKILMGYKASFVDNLTENFIQIWDDLESASEKKK